MPYLNIIGKIVVTEDQVYRHSQDPHKNNGPLEIILQSLTLKKEEPTTYKNIRIFIRSRTRPYFN